MSNKGIVSDTGQQPPLKIDMTEAMNKLSVSGLNKNKTPREDDSSDNEMNIDKPSI